MDFLKNPANRAWLVLLAATGVTFWLGEHGIAGTAAMLTMLGLALVKGRLVALDFMELRHAPFLWKALVIGWLVLVIGFIVLGYWLGLR